MAQDLADKIASLSIKHYLALPGKSGKPCKPGEWTLMSAVVLETEDGTLKVVALGTGSKCLGKNELSRDGGLVADSHAEVIARRATILYIYGQLKHLLDHKKSEIFDRLENCKACVKPGTKFHLFTSHTPCGDASIIPKTEVEDLLEPNCKVPRAEGQSDVHRTGAKCVPGGPQDPKLPGSAYHSVLAVRTKPGRGDPTSSLSCSDKISKWCAVGFQGALLSMLIDHRLNFASIVMPSNCPYSEASLKRAIVSRLPLSCFFPTFLQSSVKFPHCKDTGKPCPTSLIWSDADFLGNKKLEVAVDGRRQGLTKSKALTSLGRLKLCKLEIFSVYCEVASKLGLKLDISDSYRKSKDKSLDYQNLWNRIKTIAFPEWPVKESTSESFILCG